MSRVAIIGEVGGRGGAERVKLEIARTLNADIYSVPFEKSFGGFEDFNIYKENLISDNIPSHLAKIFISDLEKKLRHLRLELDYDLIVVTKNVGLFSLIDNDSKSIIYCHGPPSYIYQHKEFYAGIYGPIFSLWSDYWTAIYKNLSSFPDKWLVNSRTTQSIIKDFWGQDSTVVYPPVNVSKFENEESNDYFLSVQNLSAAKRVDWQVKAFNQLDEKLIIVGSGPEKERLEAMSEQNIEFKDDVTDKELVELYSHCKAVIQTNPHEDFGIVPIEAMASGKPAICPNRAGFTETIVDGKTGILFDEPFVENLRDAVSNFDCSDYNIQECQRQAEKFTVDNFRKRIKEELKG